MVITFLFLMRFYLFTFRERGREGERKRGRATSVWEKHQSVASHTHPNQGPNPQPRRVPWPGIKPVTFCFAGQGPTNWATPVRVRIAFLMEEKQMWLSRNIKEFGVFLNTGLAMLENRKTSKQSLKKWWLFIFILHIFFTLHWPSGVSNILVPLGHTGRRVILGHTLNTLQHIITKKLIMF